MKKSKFNILYEEIMDILQKSQVQYQLQSDFQQQVKNVFTTLPFEEQIDFVKHMQRKHWDQPDKLQTLKIIALQLFGDNFETNPYLFIEHQKQLKKLARLNKK